MNKLRNILLLLLITVSLRLSGQEPIKIACVGNSITYGAGMVNPEKNAYPKQLQNLLGENYEVKNFGVNGNTLLKKGNYPYWKSDKYKEALAFAPDVVYIKLGTNDSKIQNRIYLDSDFENDYKALIQSFKEKNSKIRVVLLLPVPSFLNDSTSIWNPVIKNKIIPLTQKVAFDTHSEVIDLYHLFVGNPSLFPDKIHPSSLGASVIARRIYENAVQKTEEKGIGINLSETEGVKKSSFYGFVQNNFKYKGINCRLVEPKIVAPGKPWVLRARFWGHEPQTDIALLERGFHIAFCNVSNLFGNKQAVKRWNNFYKLMTNAGLSKKVVLEGMSRGGLIVYNWAAKNPKKVAGIYADAPVLDGKSWPEGFWNGQGSPNDWERFKKVYKLKNAKKEARFKGNPIHKIKRIAKAGFPMFHVVGETDKVVPVSENTEPFKQGIKSMGGDIEVIYKPNNGHHPHSLPNPTPIVDFMLRATGQKVNFATIPSPSAEYRAGAGWTNGTDWWAQAKDIDSVCQTLKNIDLLFIGNSITQSWGGNRNYINGYAGADATKTYFKDIVWMNAGISGDRTEHILWRLKNGSYEKSSPKTVVITIGVNNFPYNNASEIVSGIKKIIKLGKVKFKDSKIMLLGPLPTGLDPASKGRQKYNNIHKLLGNIELPDNVSYYNLISLFIDEKGFLKENYYLNDGIHLKPDGYTVWAKFIAEKMK